MKSKRLVQSHPLSDSEIAADEAKQTDISAKLENSRQVALKLSQQIQTQNKVIDEKNCQIRVMRQKLNAVRKSLKEQVLSQRQLAEQCVQADSRVSSTQAALGKISSSIVEKQRKVGGVLALVVKQYHFVRRLSSSSKLRPDLLTIQDPSQQLLPSMSQYQQSLLEQQPSNDWSCLTLRSCELEYCFSAPRSPLQPYVPQPVRVSRRVRP